MWWLTSKSCGATTRIHSCWIPFRSLPRIQRDSVAAKGESNIEDVVQTYENNQWPFQLPYYVEIYIYIYDPYIRSMYSLCIYGNIPTKYGPI